MNESNFIDNCCNLGCISVLRVDDIMYAHLCVYYENNYDHSLHMSIGFVKFCRKPYKLNELYGAAQVNVDLPLLPHKMFPCAFER